VPVPLRPKTWSVLRYLAERPGELVSKDDLLNAVWTDVAVTESVLSKSIGELRAALGDSFKAPRLIETVQRRGFRFIAETLASDSEPLVAGFRDDEPEARDQQPGPDCFVGRAKELRRLAALFARARAGERQVVFVTGPAGIGKTALMEAFLDSPAVRDAEAPVWIARGLCVEQHGSREAYLPVIEALERLAHRPDAGRLARLLRRVAPTWLAQIPWLIGDGDEQALRQSLQAVRPERMLREFAALIEALTTDVTLVLVLEDLHWTDASTVDLLSMLAERRESARLLVIGTYRPAEAVVREHVLMSAIRALRARRRCVELPLSDLTEEEVRSYLQARFTGNDFPLPLARLIYKHTDGHPLFVAAVVDHMLSRGDILHTAARRSRRPMARARWRSRPSSRRTSSAAATTCGRSATWPPPRCTRASGSPIARRSVTSKPHSPWSRCCPRRARGAAGSSSSASPSGPR
jgi:DNA-binding winged helix-turn-helix (wHTH) protein